MTEKISIFDVVISCIKAKEAMMQAIGFMKGDSVNTIELVSMESLMKEHENPEWKKKVSMQDLVLPGSVEILEAAKTDDARLLRETDNKLFLRMFLKYLQKNHHKIYLLAASQEELVKAEEALENLDKFLSDALLAGFEEVLVYHGIGTGKLAFAVKEYLKKHPKVRGFEDAHPSSGGFGAKVIKL